MKACFVSIDLLLNVLPYVFFFFSFFLTLVNIYQEYIIFYLPCTLNRAWPPRPYKLNYAQLGAQ